MFVMARPGTGKIQTPWGDRRSPLALCKNKGEDVQGFSGMRHQRNAPAIFTFFDTVHQTLLTVQYTFKMVLTVDGLKLVKKDGVKAYLIKCDQSVSVGIGKSILQVVYIKIEIACACKVMVLCIINSPAHNFVGQEYSAHLWIFILSFIHYSL